MIPYSKQKILADDIKAVTSILKSDYLTQGPTVPRFESAIKNYVNSKHAIAVNSATSGLHIACLALGLSKDDIVWTSPISFVASANCALFCGANVDFIDIDKENFNLSITALNKKLIEASKLKKLPKIIIPVHMAGQSCDMKALSKLSKKYGFKIIEDASHAIGGEHRKKKIGSCVYSHACVFSFHPVKIITTFEGGIVTTNDSKLAIKMAALRSHGIVSQNFESKENEGAWYYEQQSLGFNYRMSEVEAALGISQLNKIDKFVNTRNTLARNYQKLFKKYDHIDTPQVMSDNLSSYHLYIIRFKDQNTELRNLVFRKLREAGYFVNVHYIPIYRQPYYAKFGYQRKQFPQSEAYYAEAISIPLHPDITKKEQSKIVKIITSNEGYQAIF